jgi:hypothetical protein
MAMPGIASRGVMVVFVWVAVTSINFDRHQIELTMSDPTFGDQSI